MQAIQQELNQARRCYRIARNALRNANGARFSDCGDRKRFRQAQAMRMINTSRARLQRAAIALHLDLLARGMTSVGRV